MKKIGIAIIITTIIIIIIISSLLIILNNSNTENIVQQGDTGIEINYDETVTEVVSDNIDFFTIQNCIQRYLDTINLKSSTYYDEDEQIISDTEIAGSIYNMLSNKYIEENSIKLNNVLNYVDKVEEKLIFVPLKMNTLDLGDTTKFSVYGFAQTISDEYVRDVYYIINVDNVNNTFSVTPLSNKKYTSIDDIVLDREEEEIILNENNNITKQKISDEYLCKQYFLIQKRLMLVKPEESYNYLNEEYKQKRFGSLESYKNYIEENKQHLSKMAIREYEVNRIGNNAEYICKDQFENYYIFEATNVLNYTVMLDAYTVPSEEIMTEYSKYSNSKKVLYNVNKWVQMVNNRDYEGAFEVLNETFRNNNWNSLEDFKKYIDNNYPLYYKVEYVENQEYAGTYTQSIILKDVEEKNTNQKSMTIIMKLKDNMDFEMSFSVE